MSDPLTDLAEAAGIAPRWEDVHGKLHEVKPETLCAVLDALGLPGRTDAQRTDSMAELARRGATLPPLVTATAGQPFAVPGAGPWRLTLEDGTSTEHAALPVVSTPGYHRLESATQSTTLAVAPPRGYTVQDAAPGLRPWALAVQLYGLRRAGDAGLGDFRALQDLLGPAARLGAAGVAISPVHAQFSADRNRFSPYSPSSRIQLNVLHAGIDVPPGPDAARLEALDLIDWPEAARLRLDALRAAFENADPATLASFAAWRATEGRTLETHATFEALHAQQFAAGRWHWRTWPAELQDPSSAAVREFSGRHAGAVTLHAFMQFAADRSLAETQAAARAAGMPIGLIADLAVGADSGGSHCWSRQDETLIGMGIGAPPDLLSTHGQSWGLAAFSPRGLRDNGYRAFIEMLRHAMRHAGGVRIDHALGLARLWVVPDGASAADGAYLGFPLDDMLRLIALESSRHKAIVMGEDLGTIPEGFQDRMAANGTLGMRVLWFEKKHGLFTDPGAWTKDAAAMSSTHDLSTIAGWWTGHDLDWRKRLDLAGGAENHARDEHERLVDRDALWAAMQFSGAASGPAPPPFTSDPSPVVDAAIRHLATSACDLVILPIEDARGLVEQPNLPGTMDGQHPNWRRRLPGPAATLLDPPDVVARLTALTEGRATA